jgi:hypothetical protein
MPAKKVKRKTMTTRIGSEYEELRREVAKKYGFSTFTEVDQFIALRYREYEEMFGLTRKGANKAQEILFGSGGFR